MDDGVRAAIYDQAGRAVSGLRLRELRYSSALPGGFGRCEAEVEGSGRLLALEAGDRLVILQGGAVCWWGWIEDVQVRRHGHVERAAVLGLGPWQQLLQRLVNASWSDVTSSYIVRDVLAAYCPEISHDYSQLSNSGVALTRAYQHEPAARVVEDVCAGGDAGQRPLLFAVWEPAGSRTRLADTSNLVRDSEFEQLETHWEKSGDGLYYIDSVARSPRYAWKFNEGTTGGLWQRADAVVAAGASYVVEYYVWWTAHSGMSSEIRVDWYDGAHTFLSSSYAASLTSNGTTGAWQYGRGTVTAPAGAAQCRLFVGGAVGSGGGRYYVVDDVRMYLAASTLDDVLPRARLWARDLSEYDYTVRSASLAQGVRTVETTRDLANAVLAKYGSGSATAYAQDTASQAVYRRRDYAVDAGQVALADAQAQRDVWLRQHGGPGVELETITLRGPGAVRTRRGLAVHPARLRAGDRLMIADGRLAGTVVMAAEVEYRAGEVRVRPETYTSLTRLLARV